ncbi:transcriptional regulator protein [Zopfochytrium polystomum]|nr:transcriptional regulator protein [Zopfochytrium polystomum]
MAQWKQLQAATDGITTTVITTTSDTRSVILLTGVTGKTAPPRARLRSLGVDVVVGDLISATTVRRAMRTDVRTAFFLPARAPLMLQHAAVFAAVAEDARVPQIVMLSQWLASPNHRSLYTQQVWLAERVFRALQTAGRASLTVVAPGYFADNWLGFGLLRSAVQMGVLPTIFGTGTNAPPSNEDIGRCCAAVLAAPLHQYAGQTFRPTGPTNLSWDEMVAVIAKVAGWKSLRVMHLPRWMASKAMSQQGIPPFAQANFLEYPVDSSAGAFAVNAPTNHVKFLTGCDHEGFETIVRRYAAAPANRRSVANFLAALFGLMGIMFTRGWNLKKWAKGFEVLASSETEEVMDSDDWRESRLGPPVIL